MTTFTIIEDLLFGSGAWIGFTLLVLLFFIMIAIYKWTGVITGFLSMLFGLKYYTIYSAGSNDFMWLFMFAWIGAFLQFMFMIKRKS